MTKQKRILMFATYPVNNAIHGGQKRVGALIDEYKKFADVQFCAIFHRLSYKDYGRYDIKLPRKYDHLIASNPLTSDVVTGRLIAQDPKLRHAIGRRITSYNPDIIEVEHPFLYIGLQEILEEVNYKGKLVYSSHNVEAPMKEEMLLGEGYSAELTKEFCDEIHVAEVALSKKADLILAVSPDDAVTLGRLSGDTKKVVLAQNGIAPFRTPNEADVTYWRDYFAAKGITQTVLFVGSAHPPNWVGFETMIGSAIGFLKPSQSIVFAGGIGDYLRDKYSGEDITSTLLWKRAIAVGRLSEERLQALLYSTNCLILPITEGGGTNLKTAEALLTTKPVVGTSHAFRGYDQFIGFPTLTVADNPKDFRNAIAATLTKAEPKLSSEQHTLLTQVTWAHCLAAAIQEMKTL